ncbi:Nup85 nucleoporin-domain-containing protein [Gaertneriomyces semiglobifer]|nr:Nup85 nucleoporin-domain-containing protein [Gaertneriomyces semiglobifer]
MYSRKSFDPSLGKISTSIQKRIAFSPWDNARIEQENGVLRCLQCPVIPNYWVPLLLDLHDIFMDLQTMAEEELGYGGTLDTEDDESALELVAAASSNYRAAIKDHNSTFVEKGDPSVCTVGHSLLQLFEALHVVPELPLHTAEGAQPWYYTYECMQQWLVESYPVDAALFSSILESQTPRTHPGYWTCIYQYLIRGQFHYVSSLLSRHPDVNVPRSFVSQFLTVFESMPIPSSYAFPSNFKIDMAQWRERHVKSLAESFLTHQRHRQRVDDGFDLAIGILAGDTESIVTASRDWREALVGRICFEYFVVKPEGLKDIIHDLKQGSSSSSLAEVSDLGDQIDEAVMEGRFLDVIGLLADCEEDTIWLLAHVMDLFCRAEVLDMDMTRLIAKEASTSAAQECERVLMRYAKALVSHPSLLATGLEYMAYCPTFGPEVEEFILRIPLTCDERIDTLVRFCEDCCLEKTRRELHRIIARKRYACGRKAEALEHFIRAEAGLKCALLVEEALQAYLQNGCNQNVILDFPCDWDDDVLSWSGHLRVLSHLRQFIVAYTDEEYKAAGWHLWQAGARIPRKFLIIVYTNLYKLLRKDKCHRFFNSTQINNFRRWLAEDTTYPYRTEEFFSGLRLMPNPIDQDKMWRQLEQVGSALKRYVARPVSAWKREEPMDVGDENARPVPVYGAKQVGPLFDSDDDDDELSDDDTFSVGDGDTTDTESDYSNPDFTFDDTEEIENLSDSGVVPAGTSKDDDGDASSDSTDTTHEQEDSTVSDVSDDEEPAAPHATEGSEEDEPLLTQATETIVVDSESDMSEEDKLESQSRSEVEESPIDDDFDCFDDHHNIPAVVEQTGVENEVIAETLRQSVSDNDHDDEDTHDGSTRDVQEAVVSTVSDVTDPMITDIEATSLIEEPQYQSNPKDAVADDPVVTTTSSPLSSIQANIPGATAVIAEESEDSDDEFYDSEEELEVANVEVTTGVSLITESSGEAITEITRHAMGHAISVRFMHQSTIIPTNEDPSSQDPAAVGDDLESVALTTAALSSHAAASDMDLGATTFPAMGEPVLSPDFGEPDIVTFPPMGIPLLPPDVSDAVGRDADLDAGDDSAEELIDDPMDESELV